MAIETIACPELNSEDIKDKGRREVFVYFDDRNDAFTDPPTSIAVMCPKYDKGNCLMRKERELSKKDAGYGLGEDFPCIYSKWSEIPSE